MPPDMAIDMRHTKLNAEEAALLAGELKKPSWQSKNEGIHERVSFEDAIWGFDLAGGSYYKTPLRVVGVKPGSRAEKAGIRLGDKLKRINDIDTSTLTIQEAHEIIIASGIHLKIAVTAPEDEEDAYFCYEDPLQENGYDSDEERRKAEEAARKRQVHAKVRSDWSLQWPWVSKRRIIYRESNCFMVPSQYESKHRDKYPVLPTIRTCDDGFLRQTVKSDTKSENPETQPLTNGNPVTPNNNGVDVTSEEINNIDHSTGNSVQIRDGSRISGEINNENTNGTINVNSLTDNTATDPIKINTDEQNVETDTEIETSENQSQDYENSVIDNHETADDISQIDEMEERTDDIINEVYETTESLSKDDEEHVLNSILSEAHDTADER